MSGKGCVRANPLESPFIGHWLLVVSLSSVCALLFLLLLPLVNQALHWHLLPIFQPLTIATSLLLVTTLGLLPVMRSKDENAQLGYFGVALVTIIVLCLCLARMAIQGVLEVFLFFIWPVEAVKIVCLFSVLFLGRRYYLKCFAAE